MNILWIILACFSGMFAFAFLLAGIAGLQDTTPPKSRAGAVFQFLDAIVLSGMASVIRGFRKNWSARTEERWLVFAGLTSLAASILFLCLAVYTT
jgi:hypothetical protein